MSDQFLIRRRQLLKAGAAGAGFFALGGAGLFSAGPMAQRLLGAAAAQTYIEVFPTSPLILNPFTDELPIPRAARPVGTDPNSVAAYFQKLGLDVPDPRIGGKQDSNGAVHQLGPDNVTYKGSKLPYPHVYHVRLEVGTHKFTNSKVLPINSLGQPSFYFQNGQQVPVGPNSAVDLPPSVITGFNAGPIGSAVGFPGPRINAKYGQPVILRFHNQMGRGLRPVGRSGVAYGPALWGVRGSLAPLEAGTWSSAGRCIGCPWCGGQASVTVCARHRRPEVPMTLRFPHALFCRWQVDR